MVCNCFTLLYVLVCNYAVILKHTDTLISLVYVCVCVPLVLGAVYCESQIFLTHKS